jgi:DNA-binding MarR family transcriptional regulator
VERAAQVRLERHLHPVIASVGERGSARIGQIAQDIGVDASAASKYVAALVLRGLVLRRPDPEDRRASVVQLSARGRRVRAALRDAWHDLLQEATRTWTPDKAHEFTAQYRELAAALRRLGR